MSFTTRSAQKELLDREDIPFADIMQNMKELETINRYLGGHAITLRGIQKIVHARPEIRHWHVAEIGCGGGDNLRAVRDWFARKKLQVTLTGIDINPECIRYAQQLEKNQGIHFLRNDYRNVIFEEPPHIIFSALFAHHFTDDELVEMLRWMKKHSRYGFFINDLHRHPVAYYSIRMLTQLFSKSYLVKNDAPVSVLRGFSRGDWQSLITRSGVQDISCRWQWAFRWLLTYNHG
ncbi:MAG TPA: methyltransferase domain-containing protein [Flavisolibacter sp.]